MGSVFRSLSLGKLLVKRFVGISHWKNLRVLEVRWIMTTPSLAEKAMENLKSNPYFEKYSKKIAVLQQTSPEEFLARLEEAENSKAAKNISANGKAITTTANTEAKASTNSYLQAKTKIWQEYYKHKDGLAATIPADVYNPMHERMQMFPMFLVPLPRCNGYEFIVCQCAGNEVHFTTLINYQTHKENAPECLTVWHFVELMEEKKIVLMRGEFDANILDAKEAQCLVNQLQLYYGHPDEKRTKLLERFTNSPGEFKHMDLVAELECLSL